MTFNRKISEEKFAISPPKLPLVKVLCISGFVRQLNNYLFLVGFFFSELFQSLGYLVDNSEKLSMGALKPSKLDICLLVLLTMFLTVFVMFGCLGVCFSPLDS